MMWEQFIAEFQALMLSSSAQGFDALAVAFPIIVLL